MAGLKVAVFVVCLVTVTNAVENIRALINFVNELEQDMSEIKQDMPRLETRTINKIGMLELVLRADLVDTILPAYIDDKVKQSLTKVLAHQSVSSIFTGHLRSEVRHLKHSFQERIRRFRVLMDSERDQQRQENEKLRLQILSERQYYDQQVNHLQSELMGVRRDVGHLEQGVTFLLRQSLDRNETQHRQNTLDNPQCGCNVILQKFDQERDITNKMFQTLESNVTVLKSVMGDIVAEEEKNSDGSEDDDDDEDDDEDSSEEESGEVSNETSDRLAKVERDTRSLGEFVDSLSGAVNGKFWDVARHCGCSSQFVPSFLLKSVAVPTESEPLNSASFSEASAPYISSSMAAQSEERQAESTPTADVPVVLLTLDALNTQDDQLTSTLLPGSYDSPAFHPRSIGLVTSSLDALEPTPTSVLSSSTDGHETDMEYLGEYDGAYDYVYADEYDQI